MHSTMPQRHPNDQAKERLLHRKTRPVTETCLHKGLLRALPVVMLLVLAACKVDLYSNLEEQEANEMMAILLQHGIQCNKLAGKEMTYTVQLDESHLGDAVEILKAMGYPKPKYDNLGSVFEKRGLVSSPLEERIRFIYALSQEISETISEIDGVLSARVHIVLPENDPLSDSLTPSSASVFIRYGPDSAVEASIPQIKRMVVNSIEGLSYDKVSVALFPSFERPDRESPEYVTVMGIRMDPASRSLFWMLLTGILTVLFAGLGSLSFLLWRHQQKKVPESET